MKPKVLSLASLLLSVPAHATGTLPAGTRNSPIHTAYVGGHAYRVDVAGAVIYGKRGERWPARPAISIPRERRLTLPDAASRAAMLPAAPIHISTLRAQAPGVYRYTLERTASTAAALPPRITLEVEKLADGRVRWSVPSLAGPAPLGPVAFVEERGVGTLVQGGARLAGGGQVGFALDRNLRLEVVRFDAATQQTTSWRGDGWAPAGP